MYVRYLRTACEMDVTCGLLYWIMYDFGCVLEILCGFIGLPGLYGLKYDSLITPVIAFVLVLL
jgi:hypothetical protein